MNMKKFIVALFSLAVTSFAANVQILEPTGADFSDDAPTIVKSLLRAAVSKAGNTPVEDSSEVQLRTSIMTMGGYYLVVCDQVKAGAVVNSNKQKAAGLDDLDVAIEKATVGALSDQTSASNADLVDGAPAESTAEAKKEPLPVNTSVITVEVEEKPAEPKNFNERKPTRNYKGYGLGASFWYNYSHSYMDKNDDGDDVRVKEGGDVDVAYAFRFAYIWETAWSGAILFQSHTNVGFGDYFQLHEAASFGGRYYFGSTGVAPFVGGGIGLGFQIDTHYEHLSEIVGYGLVAEVDMGLVLFRTSSVQLETGFHYDLLWDTFKSFDRHFGALTFYIGINL